MEQFWLMRNTKLFIVAILLCPIFSMNGQGLVKVKLKHYQTLITLDTIIAPKQDTVFYLPKTVRYKIKKDKDLKSAKFYDKLEGTNNKTSVTKTLFNIMTVDSLERLHKVPRNAEEFKEYEGRRIANIRFKKVLVWSGSVTDTLDIWDNWFTRAADNSHFGTRESVLRNNMLFEEGDFVTSISLADNERILRRLNYIEDARIYVTKDDGETVELTIVTKDVYSYGIRLYAYGLSEYETRLFDRNFLGYGNEFSHAYIRNKTGSPINGYQGFLKHNNIRGTFINGQLTYRNAYDEKITRAKVDRQFITSDIKYAGAVESFFQDARDSVFRGTDSAFFIPFRKGFNSAWFGRSYQVGYRTDRKSIALLASIDDLNFFDRPAVSKESNIRYHEELLAMGSVVFTKRDYVKDRMVNRFGITEDIPVGYQLGIDYGYNWKEFYQYHYGGIQAKYASVSKNKVGLNLTLRGGAIYREGLLEDKVLKLSSKLYSALHSFGKFRHRSFFEVSYHTATKIHENTRTVVGDAHGLRGLDELDTDGNQRITFNYDHIFFTPWYLLGFQLAPYVYSDLGFSVGNSTENAFSSVGMGFRMRNESLVIRTIHFRVGYHPQISDLTHNRYSFTFSLDDAIRFLDIRPNKPSRTLIN